MNKLTLLSISLLTTGLSSGEVKALEKSNKTGRPNILWITCEDISPYLECYGYPEASTPNLNKLATEGVRYTHAFANVPVCSPTRYTIITGTYASSYGTQNMRSSYKIPAYVNSYTKYLRDEGYYCTNNSKTDYNTGSIGKNIWNASSNSAHYKNRPAGDPFFAIFNITNCHESRLHGYTPGDLRHNPNEMDIPPYLPDVAEVRNDWAREYDVIQDMDTQVGILLQELDNSGLADNTVVIFYSDHGGIVGRSKRFIYDTGTRVPLIVRVPEAYREAYKVIPNSVSDRLVSFVDLGPTAISMAGGTVPDYMQGEVFLGPEASDEPEYVYFFRNRMDERIDMMRGLCDKRYRYIRNFMPHRPLLQNVKYLWKAPNMQSWEREYKAGNCNETQSVYWHLKPAEELYDMEADPWEVNNLADDPAYADVLSRFRQALKNKIIETSDLGFIPEGEQLTLHTSGKAIHDHAGSPGNYPLNEILDMANMASDGDPENIPVLLDGLSHANKYVRHWAATGFAVLREKAEPAKDELKAICNLSTGEPSVDVSLPAAEALFFLDEKQSAYPVFQLALAQSNNNKVQLHALNIIQNLGSEAILTLENQISGMTNRNDEYVGNASGYALTTKNSAKISQHPNELSTLVADLSSPRFDIYPNPAMNMLNFSNPEDIKEIKIFDVRGALVLSASSVDFPIVGLKSGIYFVTIKNMNNQVTYSKFLKN